MIASCTYVQRFSANRFGKNQTLNLTAMRMPTIYCALLLGDGKKYVGCVRSLEESEKKLMLDVFIIIIYAMHCNSKLVCNIRRQNNSCISGFAVFFNSFANAFDPALHAHRSTIDIHSRNRARRKTHPYEQKNSFKRARRTLRERMCVCVFVCVGGWVFVEYVIFDVQTIARKHTIKRYFAVDHYCNKNNEWSWRWSWVVAWDRFNTFFARWFSMSSIWEWWRRPLMILSHQVAGGFIHGNVNWNSLNSNSFQTLPLTLILCQSFCWLFKKKKKFIPSYAK